ncbi:T9SS type A sorting domain-containing protein, partial [Hymenobacter saemangeumensis]|uniref:T9SS type A sorting domain-containing protein n=1 Tax=Hymenobacter saemangeumensis TaxID=1084522 RepID=UPI0031E90A31
AQQARALAGRLQLYPNPATGADVTVALAGLQPQPPIAGQLLDGVGRVVQQLTLRVQGGEARSLLPLQGLPAGVYTLRLLPAEGPVTKRLVRQ